MGCQIRATLESGNNTLGATPVINSSLVEHRQGFTAPVERQKKPGFTLYQALHCTRLYTVPGFTLDKSFVKG